MNETVRAVLWTSANTKPATTCTAALLPRSCGANVYFRANHKNRGQHAAITAHVSSINSKANRQVAPAPPKRVDIGALNNRREQCARSSGCDRVPRQPATLRRSQSGHGRIRPQLCLANSIQLRTDRRNDSL